MTPIGGYFEWETLRGPRAPHPNATLALNSARSCVRVLVELCRPRRVWVPYYTCDALTSPLIGNSIEVEYYPINPQFELDSPWPQLEEREFLVYINYFGIKTDFVQKLEWHYNQQLWVDNTQAFFYQPQESKSFHFNSSRKFFGVPDGAYLYCPKNVSVALSNHFPENRDFLYDHLFLRLLGQIEAGYSVFQENERRAGEGVAGISKLSSSILSQINYSAVASRRRHNYSYLDSRLRVTNRLHFSPSSLKPDDVPFCYPFLPVHPIKREFLCSQSVFVPCLWRECLARCNDGFSWEKKLSAELLSLPIDHRYVTEHMDRIVEVIQAYER